jgi:hypothetical protein
MSFDSYLVVSRVVVTAIVSSRRCCCCCCCCCCCDSAARDEDHWTNPETNPSFWQLVARKELLKTFGVSSEDSSSFDHN